MVRPTHEGFHLSLPPSATSRGPLDTRIMARAVGAPFGPGGGVVDSLLPSIQAAVVVVRPSAPTEQTERSGRGRSLARSFAQPARPLSHTPSFLPCNERDRRSSVRPFSEVSAATVTKKENKGDEARIDRPSAREAQYPGLAFCASDAVCTKSAPCPSNLSSRFTELRAISWERYIAA